MQAFNHTMAVDAVSYSSDTSRWSSPSRSDGSDSPQYIFERKKKAREVNMQKITSTIKHPVVKLPPIKPLQTSKPSMQAASSNRIRELKSKEYSLQQQQQQCQSRTGNRLLKREQHRHTVALQHFQNSEDSISQTVTKNKNEVRALQELLRNTRTCRDNLARQLQATERKLLHTKETLQQLQLLIQDQSLLEREELTLKLAKASAEMEEKDKKLLDTEKRLELCQALFKRQIIAEQRRTKEARKISTYRQDQIHQLTKRLADREREIEKHNIYSHCLQKESSNRGRKNKMVQTDGLVQRPADGASLLENEYSGPVQRLEQQEGFGNWCYGPVQQPLVIKNPEREGPANLSLQDNHQEDTQISKNISGKSSSSDESPEPQTEEDEASESTRAFHASEPAVKYLFSDVCSAESPEKKNTGDCVKEKAVSEALHVSEDKRGTEHESRTAFILEQRLNPSEPQRKEFRLPKFRHYTFTQTTENLHNGRPAYSSVDLSLHESSKVESLRRMSDCHIPDEKTEGGAEDNFQSE